ncbi:ABC transporter substrate-binding protein [Alicyclobacillaceae bacterium I2511]|nr:ABC transporter substrate-binding protein [Alicyclobacillaceae bacterium I2511]
MRRKKGTMTVASAAVLSLVLVGCGANSPAPSNTQNTTGTGTASANKPVPGGSVTLDFVQNIRDLDPAIAYDTQSDEVVSQLYDQLVTWQGNTDNIVPMAAKDWTVSADGLTYTFHLHQDMKFWNGDPVTAQSFIDEFQRVLNPNLGSGGSGFYTNIQGGQAYLNKKATSISGLSAPSPYTLVIKLTKPEKFFLDTLAMPFISAVDQKFIDKVGNKAFDATQAMGSGPFELTSSDITPNQIILTKNPNYWRTDSYGNHLPYLNKVTINISNNDQLDTLHFEQGQTAWIGWNFGGDGIPASSYPQFMANPKYAALTQSLIMNSVQYVGLNTTQGPTKNPLVRQAIEYAINKPDILRLNNGRGQIANQPLPPGIQGYVQNLPADATYSYNPQKAIALLKQAGYPTGFTIDMYSANDGAQLTLDQGIQSQLAKVGIKVNIKASSWGTFLNVAEAGKAPMDWLAWIQDFPDASDFLNTLFNSSQIPVNNNQNYNNANVDSWLNTAEYSMDAQQRNQLYGNVTDQIMKDAVWVPIWYDKFTAATQPWVHGFYIPAVGEDPIEWVWINKSHQ